MTAIGFRECDIRVAELSPTLNGTRTMATSNVRWCRRATKPLLGSVILAVYVEKVPPRNIASLSFPATE
jgi:hypothetical protein